MFQITFLGIFSSRTYSTVMCDYDGLFSWLGLLDTVSALINAYAGIRASLVIHERLISRCLCCPLHVYTTTPAGRFINRFSNDMATVDFVLPFTYRSIINSVTNLVLTIAIIAAHMPSFLLVILILAPIFIGVQVSKWQKYLHDILRGEQRCID